MKILLFILLLSSCYADNYGTTLYLDGGDEFYYSITDKEFLEKPIFRPDEQDVVPISLTKAYKIAKDKLSSYVFRIEKYRLSKITLESNYIFPEGRKKETRVWFWIVEFENKTTNQKRLLVELVVLMNGKTPDLEKVVAE